jgi:hypothetical protein
LQQALSLTAEGLKQDHVMAKIAASGPDEKQVKLDNAVRVVYEVNPEALINAELVDETFLASVAKGMGEDIEEIKKILKQNASVGSVSSASSTKKVATATSGPTGQNIAMMQEAINTQMSAIKRDWDSVDFSGMSDDYWRQRLNMVINTDVYTFTDYKAMDANAWMERFGPRPSPGDDDKEILDEFVYETEQDVLGAWLSKEAGQEVLSDKDAFTHLLRIYNELPANKVPERAGNAYYTTFMAIQTMRSNSRELEKAIGVHEGATAGDVPDWLKGFLPVNYHGFDSGGGILFTGSEIEEHGGEDAPLTHYSGMNPHFENALTAGQAALTVRPNDWLPIQDMSYLQQYMTIADSNLGPAMYRPGARQNVANEYHPTLGHFTLTEIMGEGEWDVDTNPLDMVTGEGSEKWFQHVDRGFKQSPEEFYKDIAQGYASLVEASMHENFSEKIELVANDRSNWGKFYRQQVAYSDELSDAALRLRGNIRGTGIRADIRRTAYERIEQRYKQSQSLLPAGDPNRMGTLPLWAQGTHTHRNLVQSPPLLRPRWGSPC